MLFPLRYGDVAKIWVLLYITPFSWPGTYQAAVSLSFDDGMASQLETAIPMLDQAGLRGTFYLNPRDSWEQDLAIWKPAAAVGHELGNHTVTHPCSAQFGWSLDGSRKPLEIMTLWDIEQDIVLAAERLQALCPHQGRVSFAYPCYHTWIGQGTTHTSYVPVVARHCTAGRTRGERTVDPQNCDLFHLNSLPVEHRSGADLVHIVTESLAQGRWAILTFHGVDEGHLSVSADALQTLVDFLAAHARDIWVDTVQHVANHIHGQRGNGA